VVFRKIGINSSHGYWGSVEGNSRIERNVVGRHRKEDWFDSLLHQPLRERPHRALDCNARKIRSRIGSSDVLALLRRRKTTRCEACPRAGRPGLWSERQEFPHAVALPPIVGTHFATRSEAAAFYGVENGVTPQVGAGAMKYCLPRLEETWVGHAAGETYLFSRFDGESGFISTFRGTIDHETAHRRHTATVRRFRRLQRLWRVGKYFSFSRSLLLQSLQSKNEQIAD
jgi:hypothetical protein